MDSKENDRADETGEPGSRSVGGILVVIGALFVLVVAMQMCQ